ncbi:MAG: hypothetical protein MUO26_16060 [Methanotrichaceae archaeon]|nr:hypothetical protein [Methanotrichaceae archaeon]
MLGTVDVQFLDKSGTKKTRIEGFEPMKYEICGKEDVSFFKVSHKVYGGLKICGKCFEKERSNLNPIGGNGCTCCR